MTAPGRGRARALAPWMTRTARDRLDPVSGSIAAADLAAPPQRDPIDQGDLVAPVPAELSPHLTALRASPGAQRMYAQGWEVVWITDLRRIVAAQPVVGTEAGPDDAPLPATGDLAALARLTLPVDDPPATITRSFDEDAQTWTVSSPNPNLRITGMFGGELEPGVEGIGFLFSVLPSYLSVAERSGRLVLRDGYHRAYRLLAAGITAAPAFWRALAEDEAIFRTGMLPAEVYLGEDPPTLADYRDDAASVDVWMPVRETTAHVQATPTRLVVGTIA